MPIFLLDIVLRNGQNLLHLINDILDLSKIESEKALLDSVDVNIEQILADVCETLWVKASKKRLYLDVQYEGTLPKTIATDAVRLRQILFNIIGNAIKFTEQGGVSIMVRLAMHDGVRKLRFDVKDTGIGIRDAIKPHLFQPFTPGDMTLTKKHGGTGLGLVISQRLVRLMGGDIEFASEEGQGTTFTIWIDPGPINETTLVTLPTDEERAGTGGTQFAPVLRGRVLLAEDVPDSRDLLVYMLADQPELELVTAMNGQEAFDLAMNDAKGFDLILMDLQMPVMDGLTATRRLRAAGFTQPIVALTAYAMEGDEVRAMSAGCNGHLAKPYSRRDLLRVLERYLEKTANRQ